MRVDTAAFAERNLERTKRPRFTVELSFNEANTELLHITSHQDTAYPDGATTVIKGAIRGLSGTSQTLNPDKATSTVGNTNFQLVDKAGQITRELDAQLTAEQK